MKANRLTSVFKSKLLTSAILQSTKLGIVPIASHLNLSRFPIHTTRDKPSKKTGFGHESHHISFEVLGEEHITQSTNVLADAFTHRLEPVCHHLIYSDFQFFANYYLEIAATEGKSMVAVDKSTGSQDTIASVVVVNDFLDKEDPEFLEQLRKRAGDGFDRVFAICEELDETFYDKLVNVGELELGNVWHIWLGGTHKEYLHEELLSTLLNKNIELAKAMGYKYAIGECTNIWSKHAMEKCGAKPFHTIKYDTWEYPKGSGFFPMHKWKAMEDRNEFCLMVVEL